MDLHVGMYRVTSSLPPKPLVP